MKKYLSIYSIFCQEEENETPDVLMDIGNITGGTEILSMFLRDKARC